MKFKDLTESSQKCPHCGGPMFSEMMMTEKKDACYYKVKANAKVWPSAYASGRLVQCRKKGAANYGNKSKNESVTEAIHIDVDLVRAVFYVAKEIYDGAKVGNDMTDTIADELGDYFDDVEQSGLPKLKRAYAAMRDTADEDPNIQKRAAGDALLTLNTLIRQGTDRLRKQGLAEGVDGTQTILSLLKDFVKTREEPEDRKIIAGIYKAFQQGMKQGFTALYNAWEFDIDADFYYFAKNKGVDLHAVADQAGFDTDSIREGLAKGHAPRGEYSRVLSALGLYYPDKFSMEELNTPDWHRVIANKADVPVEYAGKVIDDFTRPVDGYDDEWPEDDENVSEGETDLNWLRDISKEKLDALAGPRYKKQSGTGGTDPKKKKQQYKGGLDLATLRAAAKTARPASDVTEDANPNFIWIQGDFDGDTAVSGPEQGSWRDQTTRQIELIRGRLSNVERLDGPPAQSGKTIKQARIPLTLDAGGKTFSTTGVDLQLTVAPNGYVTKGEYGRVVGTAVVKIMRPGAANEGQEQSGGEPDIQPGMRVSQGTVVKVQGNTVTVKASNGDMMTMNIHDVEKSMAENYNPEYDDEAGMADNNLETLQRAVEGIDDLIQSGDNLPEWCQEKIAVAKSMLVAVWDYMYSEEASDEVDPEIDAMFEAMQQLVSEMAHKNRVSEDLVWESFEALPDNVLYETAAWRRKEGKSKKGGLNAKGVASYRRENPGSKLQMAVTTKPSKLKPGSKAAKRRKSFCARMSGVKGPMKKPNGKPTRKALALRKWNC